MGIESSQHAVTGNDIFAYIIGFATKMLELSQKIHPLDLSNVVKLNAKLQYHVPSRLKPNFCKGMHDVESVILAFVNRTENCGDWNEYWTYMGAFLQDFRDSAPDLNFYDFNRGTYIDYSNFSKEKCHQMAEKWEYRKYYEHPESLQKAFRNFNALIRKYSSDYSQNAFHQMGIKLAECYAAPGNYEVYYPEALKSYYLDFSAKVPISSNKLKKWCTTTKENIFNGWKEYLIRFNHESMKSCDGVSIRFEDFPVLKITWNVFEESISILQNACVLLKSGKAPHSISREEMISINELLEESKCKAVIHGISRGTLKKELKGAGIASCGTDITNRGRPDLFPRAESMIVVRRWKNKQNEK